MSSGYVGIDKDYFVSVKEVLNITAETGALETQDRVRDLPPADVIEVRHSVWRVALADPDKEYECTRCKKAVGWKYLYCPNCGAKMDGESDE